MLKLACHYSKNEEKQHKLKKPTNHPKPSNQHTLCKGVYECINMLQVLKKTLLLCLF